MTGKNIFVILVALAQFVSCGGGTPVLQPPPDGIGDDVVIPPELQTEYSKLVDANDPGYLPEGFELLGSNERRALGLYIYDHRDYFPPRLILIGKAADHDKCVQVIQEQILPQFDGEAGCEDYAHDNHAGEPLLSYELSFTGGRSKGFLAWYGDQIVKNYSSCFLIAWPGPVYSI
jgi:hypothetical protein